MNATCSYCGKEMSPGTSCTLTHYDDFSDKTERARVPWGGQITCGDCNTPPQGLHHPGCDMERCPECRGQAISCSCTDDDLTREHDLKERQ